MKGISQTVQEVLFARPFSKEEKRLMALPEQILLTQQNELMALSETHRLRVFIGCLSTKHAPSPDFLMSIPAVKSLLYRPITSPYSPHITSPAYQTELLEKETSRFNNQVLTARLLDAPDTRNQTRISAVTSADVKAETRFTVAFESLPEDLSGEIFADFKQREPAIATSSAAPSSPTLPHTQHFKARMQGSTSKIPESESPKPHHPR